MSGDPAGWALVDLVLWIAIEILLKASVVVALAFTATLALERAPASVRHAAWCIALILLVAGPVLSIILPSWRPPLRALSMPDVLGESRIALGTTASSRRDLHIAPPRDRVPARRQSSSLVSDRVATGLLLLWMGGSIALASRVVVHAARVRAIARRGHPAEDDEANALFAAAGIGRTPRLVLSDEVTQPFSYGVLAPLIVWPVGSKLWSRSRRRCVLLHELAHIARGDWLLHVIGECVRALYWPNPLVWHALRRYTVERERSCDDYALRSGTPAIEYAAHLLAVARGQLGGFASVNSMAVDGRSSLAERARSLLDKKLGRGPAGGPTVALAGIVALALALPVATLDVLGQPRRIPTTEDLVEQLSRDDRPESRRLAAWWLGEHEDASAVGPLVAALQDPSAAVRQAAAWALGEIKDPEAIDALVATLEDGNLLVREMAVLALGEIEHPSAVPALIRASEEVTLRQAAAWALGQMSRGEASEARRRILGAANQRSEPAGELWTGTPQAGVLERSDDLQALLDDLRKHEADARERAALRIGLLSRQGRLHSCAPVEPLLGLLRDPAPRVRAAAIWTLDEINPSRWDEDAKPMRCL